MFYAGGIDYSRCLSGSHASLDECEREEIWATNIMAHPSKNDLPVGQTMKKRSESISTILRFSTGAKDATSSGEMSNVIAPKMERAENQGNKR